MKSDVAHPLGVRPAPRRMSAYAKRVQWWRAYVAGLAGAAKGPPMRGRTRAHWQRLPEAVLQKLAREGIHPAREAVPIALEVWFEPAPLDRDEGFGAR